MNILGIFRVIGFFFKDTVWVFIKENWKIILIVLAVLSVLYASFWIGRNKYPNCEIMSDSVDDIVKEKDKQLENFEQEYNRMQDSLERLVIHDTILDIQKEIKWRTHEQIREVYISDRTADSLANSIITRGKERFSN